MTCLPVPRISVYLADDHLVFLEGLERLLKEDPDFDCVGKTGDGRKALNEILQLKPNVAVLDMAMPSLNGLQILTSLKRAQSPTQALILTGTEAGEAVYQALLAGGQGYMLKTTGMKTIIATIKKVARGETYVAPELVSLLASQIRRTVEDEVTLSPREHEILAKVARGQPLAEIAEEINITTATARVYLRRAYKKLGVTNQAAAVGEAMRRGLIQ